MISPAEIARMAHRLGLGDKTIEKDYVLTWTLLALAQSTLCDRLAFKGGTAIKKIYAPAYRFSEDLDFTLLDDITNDDLLAQVQALFPWLRQQVDIEMSTRKVEVHSSGNPTLYLNYVGPLRGSLSSRFLKTDFTHGELLIFPLAHVPLQVSYSDCRARAERLYVYSLEEILAEKLCALLGRTEPRDLYDVYYLLTQHLVDAEAVSFRLDEKMAHKGVDRAALSDVLARKRNTLSRLWEPRLRGQVQELGRLDTVIRETDRALRQSGLMPPN